MWQEAVAVEGPERVASPLALEAASGRPLAGPRTSRLALAAAAAAILLVALGLRIATVQSTPYHPSAQARAYLVLGGQVAEHGDYSRYARGVAGTIGPSAYLPPALPYLLGVTGLVDGQPPLGSAAFHVDRIEQAVLGTAAVTLIGLIALELAGPGAGLIALLIASLYPPLVQLAGTLAPENLLTVFALAAAWCTLRARACRDSVPWLIGAGIAIGLAALSHESGLLLLIPLALGARGSRPVLGRRQVAGPGVLVVAALLTLSPWLIRDAAELHRFVPVTDRAGAALAGTYNPISARTNSWRPPAAIPTLHAVLQRGPTETEPQLEAHLAGRALTYLGDHPLAPLTTASANLPGLLELQSTGARQASAAASGLGSGAADLDALAFWIVAAMAVVGVLTRAGRRAPRWLWGVPLLVALSALLVDPRFPRVREPFDPFLIVLAACGLRPLLPFLGRSLTWLRTRFLNWQYASRA